MSDTKKALHDKAAAYAKAWSSGDPQAVAGFYASDGRIAINRGDPIVGRAAIADMAAGFYAEYPDLVVHCDSFRLAGDRALFAWTLEGTHSRTGKRAKLPGWEEWTLNEGGEVAASLGWYDAAEYDRQVEEGA